MSPHIIKGTKPFILKASNKDKITNNRVGIVLIDF